MGIEGLEQALELLRSGEASCVIMRDGAVVRTASGRGVSPLLRLYEGEADTLRGASVADKVVGKGAAVLIVLGGADAAYGEIMSEAGRDYLVARGVEAQYGTLVPRIANRDRSGLCPVEQSVLDVNDPEEALARIKTTLRRLAGAT